MKKKMDSYEVKYDLVFMNIIGIVYFLIIAIILVLLFKYGILTQKFDINNFIEGFSNAKVIFVFILSFLWLVLHEIIHGIFYVVGGADKKNISYGIALEKGIFYCKCNRDITKKNLLLSLMAPFTIIGVLTLILSFILGDFVLLYLSLINISGCCGDLTIFVFMLKRDNDILFREIGDTSTFVLTTNEKLDEKKILGIKEVRKLKENETLEETKVIKKVTITKGSWPIIIFFTIFLIFLIVLYSFI